MLISRCQMAAFQNIFIFQVLILPHKTPQLKIALFNK
jgi:hypothetical protein